MKKIGTVFVLLLLASALVLPMVAAVPLKNIEREHKGVAQHLYLFEKDSNWDIVEGGAWGHLIYHDSGQSSGKFVFNGHSLEPDTDYSLIYYPDIIKQVLLNFQIEEGGIYPHVMLIDSFDSNGDFSGTGYFSPNNLYTWDVSGTVANGEISFVIIYTGLSSGYTVTVDDADIDDEGVMTGDWESSSGQVGTFTGSYTGAEIWPHPIDVIGQGTADLEGNVHIMGNYDFSSIPLVFDKNYPDAKIWLVKTGDIIDINTAPKLSGWNPTEYLFEHNLI